MIVAFLILAWFIVACFLIDWDIRAECAFQAGADGSCPRGLTSGEPSAASIYDWEQDLGRRQEPPVVKQKDEPKGSHAYL